MTTIAVHNADGKAVGELDLPGLLTLPEKGAQPMKDAVVTYLANQRQGTASTKGKGEVAGSGTKPWRQKGTGRARSGYRQSPIWRGGGVVFGPKPRSFRKDMNRKTARLALRRALAEKAAAGTLKAVDSLTIEAPKTKHVAALIAKLSSAKSVLLVTAERDVALVRAARNIPGVEVTTAAMLNVYQVVRYAEVLATREALDGLQARLGKGDKDKG